MRHKKSAGQPKPARAPKRKAVSASQAHLALLQTGIEFQRAAKFAEAEYHYQLVLRDDPNNADAHNLLGTLAVEAGFLEKSVELLQRAVKLAPKNAVFRNNLANSLLLAEQPDKAVPHLRRAISLNPRLMEALMNMARAYRASGKSNEAVDWYRKALDRDPEAEEAQLGLADVLIDMGRQEEAMAVLRAVLETAANPVPAIVTLSAAKRFTADDLEDVKRFAALAERGQMTAEDTIALKHALGKINNDLERYDDAFRCFADAKEMAGANFDIGQYRKLIDRITSFFTKLFFAQRRAFGHTSERPVFIVGMPRSGTTLTEQILSSHPKVQGAGELRDIERTMQRIHASGQTGEPYFSALSKMKSEHVLHLAEAYLTTLDRHSRSAVRVIDKMPHNFEALGLIALMFPNARVIYCRRDPLDNCLSCFMHPFSEEHGYNTNLEKLGLYYREHARLMEHWKDVLPIEILDGPYEHLIENQEAASRRLVDFLGVEWDEACLEFHQHQRAVSTPSRWQVRQPIYGTSVMRWKHYEEHLGPLIDALGDVRAP
ncbi:MAG: tetratricopeptide repeat protein [Pseudomonadota bacterium]